MSKRFFLSVSCILALGACADDGTDPGVDSVALCDCPELAAANVTYDNVASGLSGTNAQDAVDELAARPAPVPDAVGRISIEEMTATSAMSGSQHVLGVSCPTGGSRAMGGACSAGAAVGPISILETRITAAGFSCLWNKPDGEAIEFTAQVTCLAPAE